MKKLISFLIILYGLFSFAFAQVYVSIDSIEEDDIQASIFEIIDIPVVLKAYNNSNDEISWQGNLDFYVLTDSMILSGQPPRLFTNKNVNISIGGSNDTLLLNILPHEMRTGGGLGNVIIIWPASVDPSVFTHDSIVDTITILGYLGIHNIMNNNILIYPNPAYDVLYYYTNTTYTNSYTIYNLEGLPVKQIKNQNRSNFVIIDISELKQGYYLIVSEFNNGERKIDKFIKIK